MPDGISPAQAVNFGDCRNYGRLLNAYYDPWMMDTKLQETTEKQ
jgi:hypothetical protein